MIDFKIVTFDLDWTKNEYIKCWNKWLESPSRLEISFNITTKHFGQFLNKQGINIKTGTKTAVIYVDSEKSRYFEWIEDDYAIGYTVTNDTVGEIVIYYNSIISEETIHNKFIKNIKKNIIIDDERVYSILTVSQDGFNIETTIPKNIQIDISDILSPESIEKHINIINSIETHKPGIFLISGPRGTGKTTLLRNLIWELSTRVNIIYLPSIMHQHIDSPEFITFISSISEAVLILDDADSVLKGNPSRFTPILEVMDGVLADRCNLKIIAICNKTTQIDQMVKARVITHLELNLLTTEKANKLSTKLGINKEWAKPVSLSEVYMNTRPYIKKIGF